MSRLHVIDSLASAARQLVGLREISIPLDVVDKADETAKAIMDKIQELLKEQEDD